MLGFSEGAFGILEDERSFVSRSIEGMGRGEYRVGREFDFFFKNDGNYRLVLIE